MGAPKKAATAEVALVDLEAIEPIRHDGVDVTPGDSFAASEAAAVALVDSGAARLVVAAEPQD